MTLEQMNSDEIPLSKDSINKVANDQLRQKEELHKLLASNYFSLLGEHGVSSRLNKSVEVGSIEERSSLLLERINQNKKNMTN